MVLTQLQAIKPMLGCDIKHRVKFVVLCLTHRLTKSVIRYEHFGTFNIGERDFDFCFENNDSHELVDMIIKKLGIDAHSIIDRELGEGTYSSWNKQRIQLALF